MERFGAIHRRISLRNARRREGRDIIMKTDIQILHREAEMLHIREVAAKVGIEGGDLGFYGKL